VPTHGEKSFVITRLSLSWSRNSPAFMESECSKPCSQESTIRLHLVPTEYNLHAHPISVTLEGVLGCNMSSLSVYPGPFMCKMAFRLVPDI
jgi:hypothetical protein